MRNAQSTILSFLAVIAFLTFVIGYERFSFAQEQRSIVHPVVSPAEEEDRRIANANVVTIMASGTSSIYTRFAEEIQQVLDDPKSNTIRIMPVLGRGGAQNMLDILYLRGADMGVMDDNMLQYYKQLDPVKFANLERRVNFIAKLSDAEVHLIARNEIKSIEDLRGKKVNFYQQKSSTALIAENLFKMLDIDVIPVYYHQEVANKMMKDGEIAAVIRALGAPIPFAQEFRKEDGVHFVSIEPSLKNYDKLLTLYSPAYLKQEDYPELIPDGQSVPTIANATILATYAWPENTERYKRIANFVNKFFDNIDKFMIEPRHPKWREINLAANVPGWKRFKAAEDWLNAHKTTASDSKQIRAAFDQFLKLYKKNNPNASLDDTQVNALATEFFKWWDTQKPKASR